MRPIMRGATAEVSAIPRRPERLAAAPARRQMSDGVRRTPSEAHSKPLICSEFDLFQRAFDLLALRA
jgi:hypothetical protein